jgi:hypothetical protein
MNPDDAERLIQSLFDEKISERDFVLLEEELALNEESREMFREYAFIHSQLSEQKVRQPALSTDYLTQRMQKVMAIETEESIRATQKRTGELYSFHSKQDRSSRRNSVVPGAGERQRLSDSDGGNADH